MSFESSNQPAEKTPEEIANFEENWTEVLFDRINNPEIRKQMVDIIYRDELAKQEYFKNEPFVFDHEMDTGNKVYRDSKGSQLLDVEIESFKPRTREEVEKELDEQIKKAMEITQIEFSDKGPNSERIPLYFKNPYTGEIPTNRQKSLFEAHEKGHEVRRFDDNFFDKAFDKSNVIFTDEDLKAFGKMMELDKDEEEVIETDPEKIKEIFLKYLFSGNEVAERMSQLKNYFGMRGSEKFTREHLAYARKHYSKDVGFENGMQQLFQAITPDTENKFLELINNSGI